MKKSLISTAATIMTAATIAVTAMPLTAFAYAGPSATTAVKGPVTKDQALQIALTHAGYKQNEVQFPRVKKDFDDGMEIWEVEFYKGFMEYNYDIEVSTGQIVDFDIDD